MTTILAIDTTTGPCSVAIWKDGRIAAYHENLKPAAQSATLMPMVEEALKASKTSYRDLTHVAATVGPGSFTGIRIGLATARGIAFAAGIKSLGFTTLQVLAFAATSPSPACGGGSGWGQLQEKATVSKPPSLTLPLMGREKILAILNAGKGEHYYQLFESGQAICEPAVDKLERALALAKDAFIIENSDAANTIFPRADVLARLAATHSQSAQPLTPFYIRPPDAKLPTKKFLTSPSPLEGEGGMGGKLQTLQSDFVATPPLTPPSRGGG